MPTANQVTVARILMIPVFVVLVLGYGCSVDAKAPQEWMRWLALTVFLIAAASDGLDGYIARRYNQKTRLGAILDPIADKGLLLAGLIALSLTNWSYALPVWFVVLVVTRDLIVVLGAALINRFLGPVEVQPSFLGRTATVTQMIALGLIMLLQNHNWLLMTVRGVPFTFLDLGVVIAAACTLLSGVGYVVKALRTTLTPPSQGG